MENVELKDLAWKRLWEGRWFGRLFGGGLLLGFCGYAIQGVVGSVLEQLNVQSWQDYVRAVVQNAQDLTTPVPNLTSEFVSRATSSTLLLLFFSYLTSGIAAYGGAAIVRKCLADDEKGWLADAFGGFRCPFAMLWMFFRLVLAYVVWLFAGLVPVALAGTFLYPRVSAWLASGSLVGLVQAVLALTLAASVAVLALAVPFYRYRFLFLAKADHPDWDGNACFRFCREIMKGNMRRSLRLDCAYWLPITLLTGLLLAVTAVAAVVPHVSPSLQVVLGGVAAVGLVLSAGWTIVLSQYIKVAQAFLYREICGEAKTEHLV